MSPQAREEYHAVLYKRHKDCWNKFGMSKKYSRFRSWALIPTTAVSFSIITFFVILLIEYSP